jgi:hypothetical protein
MDMTTATTGNEVVNGYFLRSRPENDTRRETGTIWHSNPKLLRELADDTLYAMGYESARVRVREDRDGCVGLLIRVGVALDGRARFAIEQRMLEFDLQHRCIRLAVDP